MIYDISQKIFIEKPIQCILTGETFLFNSTKAYHIVLQKVKTKHMFKCNLFLFHKKFTFFKQHVVLDGMVLTANSNVLDTVKTTLSVTT